MDWQNKKVVVTGGFGFIGQHLVRKLLQLRSQVIIIDRFSTGKQSNLQDLDLKVIKQDVSTSDFSELSNEKIDYIFHFGAPSSVILFNENPIEAMKNTITGFMNILKLAKTKQVKKFVYPSSGTVYGLVDPPQSEDDCPKPVNLYGIGRLACEQIAKIETDVQSTGLRIFAGYGPGEDHKGNIASPVTLFLKPILKNERPIVFGDGTQTRDFVYIDDIISVILRTAERETPSVINVGSGQSHSFNEVISKINNLTSKRIEPEYVQKPVNYLEKTESDISRLKKTLDITPMTLDEGLKRYLKEYLKNENKMSE